MQFLNKFVAVDNAILEKMRSLIAKTRIFRLRRNAPGPLRILASIVFVLFLTLPITVMDYYIPIWGTKKFGGSKWGTIGSGIGLLVGMFLGPFGLFIGAFAGAFIGEYLSNKNHNIAFKAAVESFLGLMAGIVAKTILCIVMLVYSIKEIYQSFQ